MTPLMHAINKGYVKLAKTLIELGCNIDAQDKTKRTPLMYACQRGDKEIVEYLLQLNVDINVVSALGDKACAIA